MSTIKTVTYNFLPIVVMIGLIPLVKNDYVLLLIYLVFAAVSLSVKREGKDLKAFGLGLIMLTISESIFISTGVETFTRVSLFGLMPIWLPVLWGFSFVSIRRVLPSI